MKTILVDAWNTFITENWINKEMQDLLNMFPNKKIILTNANKQEQEEMWMINLPYELFSLEHRPNKTWSWYYKKFLERYFVIPENLVYFEHDIEACKKAREIWINTYNYDKDKKDLKSLEKFLKDNL